MKNPLLTPFFSLISDRSMKSLSAAIMFLAFAVNVSLAQAPNIEKSECFCLNNATTNTNGQYRDAIIITTGIPGQTWRLVNPISGFYNPASLPPPAAPILYLNNTLIPETAPGSGIYRLEGIRVSGQGWSVQVFNAATNFVQVVNSIQQCSYPVNVPISGDINVCQGSVEAYALPPSLYHNLAWTLTGGFTATAPALPANGSTSLSVTWGPTPGRYSMGVSGIATSYASQPQGCNFSSTKTIDVVDPVPFTTIRGDFGNCIGTTETYRISASVGQLSGVVWGVFTDPAGLIPAGISTSGSANVRTVTWPNTPGTYYLRVNGNFRVDTNSDFCSFSDIKQVVIVSEATTPMACNNLVQLSMNPSCELYFTADQFLEGQIYPDASYDIIIRDIDRDTIIPNGTLGYKYINKTLEIKVVHECSGNSCWGYAKIEDKSIPDLVCPADVTITCENLGNLSVTGYPDMPVGGERIPVAGSPNTWILKGFDKCSDVTLTFKDNANTDLCGGPYSSIIERTWSVVDNSGNSASCLQVISVLSASINDVIFPGNYDSATGPNASLEACENWPKIPDGQDFAGNPSPDLTGRPFGTLCLKAAVTFSDVKLPICTNNPNTYKLIRKWTVVDHCTGIIRTHNQAIAVMDTKPPVITCPADLTTQSPGGPIAPAAVIFTNQHSCVGDWNVIAPIVINDCSSTVWTVDFLLADNNGLPPANGVYVKKSGLTEVTGSFPNFRIRNLPTGRTWVRYTVTDNCGNFSYCFTEIDVVDNQPPTPVCDKNSIIAIGANNIAYAGVLTFDDGSHDNCTLACMKIRRMDNQVDWASLPCNNQIPFTCDDIGTNKTIMVELGVWDKGGLFNSCMVEAKVQDNIFPTLTVPANTTANCYDDFTTLTRFGTATVTDNCTATITETRTDNLNECGLGTITRTFTATDAFGNKTVRNQIITVDNNRKFNGAAEFPVGDIDWPNTITLNAACIADVTPDKLPLGSARPRYLRNTECAQLASNHEDIVFNFADNVCVKILRKWTVIDWCQKNPFIPGSGEWTYTQLIMLNNTTPPVISKGCQAADLEIVQVGECRANVKVTAAATDDCTPADNLEWTYTIDENNDNTLEVANGTGKTINRDFPYGTHKITWTVKDGCKNPRTCSNIFTIRDDKKPTPYCLSEIVTVIMPSAKEVTIWASDFDLGATDNCSTKSQIAASFSATNRNDISRTIKCADLGGLAAKEFSYNVYAIDAAGNSDFCTVRLIVQDNGNSCSTTIVDEEEEKIVLKGSIYNEADEMVQNVNIELQSNQAEFPKSVITGKDGRFSFADLPVYQDYTVKADKNDDALNGVSTLDLVMIQRHILGLAELDSPYKIIAADVNNSQKVSAADLVELRKLILGIQSEFSNNRSWRFVDVAYRFIDPKNPFPFNDYMHMPNLDHHVAGIDFIAVKTGDVNGSAKANASSNAELATRSTVTLSTETVTAKTGEIVSVHLTSEEIKEMLGMQMTISWNNNVAELLEIKSDAINLKDQHIGFSLLSDGYLNISWNENEEVSVNKHLLTLKFKMLGNVNDRQIIHLDKNMLNPEIYTQEGKHVAAHQLSLTAGQREQVKEGKFELYQNVPNPFNAVSQIGFNLPKADDVTLKLFDISGKLVYQNKASYNKGMNTIEIDANALNLNGVMYYQIETDTDSATRKMIIIK